jgi:uncharacterized membrane protein YdbT with pleckstrin-like domain
MSYIRDSLGANEAVHYVAHFHWIRHAMGYGVLALSILVAIFSYSPEYPFVVLGPVLLGVILFLAIMVPIWTTEIGVTSQRLILKRGLIQRDTEEMQLGSIEQISLDQDVLGRILGYGKLHIHGTGDQDLALPAIGDPINMRKAVQEAIGAVEHAPMPDEAVPSDVATA